MNALQSRKIEIRIHLSHPGLIVVLVVIWRLRESKENVVKETGREREETNYNCRRCVNRMNSSFGRNTPAGTASLIPKFEILVSNNYLQSNLLG